MADDGTKYPRSASPNEDYNPLKDDTEARFFHQQSHDADCSEEEDQYNSVDSLPENFFQNPLYSTTPPANPRVAKLEKSKKHSSKQKVSYKEYISTKKKPHPKTPVNIIKEQYADSPVFCKLSGVDSDDNLERDFLQDSEKKKKENRENKKKIMKTSRSYERHVKATSGDLSNLDTNTVDVAMPLTPVKLDSSGRYTSVNAPRVDGSGRFSSLVNRPTPLTITLTNSLNLSSSLNFNSSLGSPRQDNRRLSVVCPECPRDRSEFYKIFSALIQMGSQPKKEKDHKRKESMMHMGAYRRQISSEQELWQERFMDLLWLELRMEHLGYSNFKDHEENLKLERAKIPQVLEDITNFKLDCAVFLPFCDIPLGNDSQNASNDVSSPEILSYESNSITTETINYQKLAISQVEELLDRLDQCEQLFPTSKAFAREYPLYGKDEFTLQVKSLYLWLNITRGLCHKMKQLGKVLGVQYIPEIDWPMMDFESPRWHETKSNVSFHRESIPEIQEPESSESEDEGIANNRLSPGDSTHSTKRVTFTMGSGKVSPTNDVPKDTSTPLKPSIRYYSSTDLSRVSSEASMDDFAKTTTFIYRKYVDKSLKRMGMNKMLLRFRELLDRTLQRAREALQKPNLSSAGGHSPKASGDDSGSQMSSSPAATLDFLYVQDFSHNPTVHRSSSLTDCGICSEQFIKMGLPSFRPSYMFLLQVFMDVVHEAVRLRLDQRPNGEPSHLSIRPLLRECKDVLQGAVIVKQYYQYMVYAVFGGEEEMMDLEQFDQDLRKMLDEYLTYLQTWLFMLQNLPDASRSLKNVLDTEWTFTKGICPYIIGGEAEAGKRFSTLASSLLNSIVDFLESGIDDFTASLYDWTMRDDEDDDLDDNGDDYLDEEDDEERDVQFNLKDTDDELDPKDTENSINREDHVKRIQELRHSFQQTSRNCKKLFNEARERATKALGFAKVLRKDLEIAADFNIVVNTADLLDKLKDSNHAMVMAPLNPGYLMFIPEKIMGNRQLILQLLNVTCGREDVSRSHDDVHKEEGYLLMVRCEGGRDQKAECPIWHGNSVKVEPTAETTIALSHIEVQGLLLVVINAGHLTTQRKEFEGHAGKTVELVNEQTSCHQAIAESLAELKSAAVELQEKVVLAIKQVDEKLNFEDIAHLEDNEKYHLLQLYRETMLKGYNFGFEYLKEVTRLVTGEPRQKLGTRLVSFAKQWMQFVTEKCDKGRGMRPKWASHGLDFLTVACQPVVLAGLTELEFQNLKHSINNCISHVIGTADRNVPVSPTHGSLHSARSQGTELGAVRSYMRFPSWPNTEPIKRSSSTISSKSDPVTSPQIGAAETRSSKRSSIESMPDVESCVYDGEDGGLILDIYHRRRSRGGSCDYNHEIQPLSEKATKKILKMEEERTKKQREQRVIGTEVSKKSETDYRINVRRVNFRWQRGLKIGEGQFGKVYSAVNMDTGELMAMKEMKFQANDHQALKEIADEIIMFEGIQHPNLIRYYGVEVHRDEMLIFMEFCDRGTIEEATKMGLPEHLIAIYTKEILKAICHLHDNNIVHRDIKGANIFLTSEGCLKLGDFGCSAKLKSQATMPGEFNNIVGTTAYMAPEVITKSGSGGHGRAADIWSLGCVVIEMVTGKRPWHELENNYQIMFKVGMGSIPSVPETLSPEGKEFISHCLEPDPEIRWSAAALLELQFVKVQIEEQDGDS